MVWGGALGIRRFANRGYACLQVNYRGSTGYGKRFLHLGDKQWGVGTMQHDLTDAVQWAIKEGIADKDKVRLTLRPRERHLSCGLGAEAGLAAGRPMHVPPGGDFRWQLRRLRVPGGSDVHS